MRMRDTTGMMRWNRENRRPSVRRAKAIPKKDKKFVEDMNKLADDMIKDRTGL